MKSFDIVGLSTGIIGVVLAVFIVDDFYIRSTISLLIICVLLILKLVSLWLYNRKLEKDHSELMKNHNTLSIQYKKKKDKLDYMKEQWAALGSVILVTLHTKQNDRLKELHNTYLRITSYLNNKED